jgi:catechol 2,3-dioxygenase-like lactoylglutathione lyase family enzyme
MTPLQWHGQLASIGLRVRDVERSARFYEDILGMIRAPGGAAENLWLGWGQGDPVLELSAGAPTLTHIALEVPIASELDGLIARLGRHGVTCTAAAEGPAHIASDPDGRELRLIGRARRGGEHLSSAGRRPIRLQHVTVSTSAMEDVLGFYRDALGMRLSDRMGHDFAWLRCGREHHTVAVVNNASPRLVDHFSFDLADWRDFRDWGDRLACAGIDVSWGPGRHGPGNNLFIMFDDPDAYHVELSAEMEMFYDDRVEYAPRVWETTPRTVNLWGQVPSWRAATTAA